LRSEWLGKEGTRRRKFYAITGQGRRRLQEELQGWRALTRHVNELLGLEAAP
jgi:DNA-binding PadR family transcriptional regulator